MGEFGIFSEGPTGTLVAARPRPYFMLQAPFQFTDPSGLVWAVPAGEVVDGASIPRAFWTVIGGPYDGNYVHASVVHDHFCRTRLRAARATHRTFYFGMRAKDVPDWQAKLMFWAVSAFGPDWMLGGPRYESAIPNDMEGAQDGGGEPIDLPAPDLVSSRKQREAAKRRFNRAARSLEESGGAAIAAGPKETVDATLDNIEAEAARARSAVMGGP